MEEAHVLLVIASQGFQSIEYNTTKTILEHAGFTVITASDKIGTAIAHDKSTATATISLDKIDMTNYLGIIFIGGPEALDHLDNQTSYKIIHRTLNQNKLIGAICIATRILAKAGILTKKRATGWNGDNQLPMIYQEHGVNYVPTEHVVVDDNIITATDPNAAQEFGKKIVTLLQSKQSWG